jgi:hypothetical protein
LLCSKMPAMILAGHPQSQVPTLLTETNISRLPLHIAKQLAGTLPKRHPEPSSSAADDKKSGGPVLSEQSYKLSRMIPQGIVLVEICGSHDLYWVRMEAVSPFLAKDISEVEESRRGENCVQEAVQTMQWMSEEGRAAMPVRDLDSFADVIPPSPEQLEAYVSPSTAKPGRKSSEGKSKAAAANADVTEHAGARSGGAEKEKEKHKKKEEEQDKDKDKEKDKDKDKAAITGPQDFVFDATLCSVGLDTTLKKGRAVANTRAMLEWIDGFKKDPSLASADARFKNILKPSEEEEHPAKTSGKKGTHGAHGHGHGHGHGNQGHGHGHKKDAHKDKSPAKTSPKATGKGKGVATKTPPAKSSPKATVTKGGKGVKRTAAAAVDHSSESEGNETITPAPKSTSSKKRPREPSSSSSTKHASGKDTAADYDPYAHMEGIDADEDSMHFTGNDNENAHGSDVPPKAAGKSSGKGKKQQKTGNHTAAAGDQLQQQPQQPYTVLYGGCTRYVSGAGVFTLREVDMNASIFSLENPKRAVRKQLLRRELDGLRSSIQELQDLTEKRGSEEF